MPLIQLPGDRQPDGGIPIADTSLTRGLALLVFSIPGAARDSITGRPFALTGSPTLPQATPAGVGHYYSGSNFEKTTDAAIVNRFTTSIADGTGDFSVLVLASGLVSNPGGTFDGRSWLVNVDNGAAQSAMQFGINFDGTNGNLVTQTGSVSLGLVNSGGGTGQGAVAASVLTTTPQTLVLGGRRRGTTIDVFVMGRLATTGRTASSYTITSTTIGLGGRNAGLAFGPAATQVLTALWNRALDDSEFLALGSSLIAPWQLFEPESIWVPVSAAATVPTLTAETPTTIGTTTATPRYTTTAASAGTLYAVILFSSSPDPTAAEIKSTTWEFAEWRGNITAPTTAGTYNWPSSATGLGADTSYKTAFVWSDGTSDSNVSVSAAWSTQALRTADSAGTFTVSSSGAATSALAAASSGAMTLSGSSAATAAVAAASAGTLTTTGTAAATVAAAAISAGTISMVATSAATATIAAASAGAVSLTGTAAATAGVSAASASTLALTGSAAGNTTGDSTLASAGTFTLSGTAAATAAVVAASARSINVTGSTAGTANQAATSAVMLTLSGSASATGPRSAASAGALDVTGSATGSAAILALSTGQILLTGSATAIGGEIVFGEILRTVTATSRQAVTATRRLTITRSGLQ